MTRRSLQASVEGISKAKAALISHSLTQAGMAADLGISRQPVSKFFQGKAVDRYLFVTICEKLNLDWSEIVASSSLLDAHNGASISQIENLVQTVRDKVYKSIQRRCSSMRVLDMEQPIELDTIYTDVNILDQVTSHRRLNISELLQDYNLEKLDNFALGSIKQKRLPAMEAVERYDKLMILGKPGSGKTMFLKWLATQCNLGLFRADCIPIFISLKDFAETKEQPSLLEYITQELRDCGVEESQAAETLLHEGQAIVLLDGLDEVKEADINQVLSEIRKFSTRFSDSTFVITCRIAALEYTFEQFTEVEVADFDDQQIANFTTKWFQVKEPIKAEHFLQKLQENQPLKELATNPLLLTLLCLVFEQRADFVEHQSELYQEVLDIWLKTWDAQRNIQRDQIYKLVSPKFKEQLLSEIAWTNLEHGEYFFQEKAIEKQITEYILSLPNFNTDTDAFQLDSEAVLKSIAAQNGLLIERAKGIYSFSHISLQKYLAGKKIADAQ